VSIVPIHHSPPAQSARGLAQSKNRRTFDRPNHSRSVLDCGSPLPLFHARALPLGGGFKFIRRLQTINLEPVNGFHHRHRGGAFKPSRRAPRIFVRNQHQPVLHRVLVNIVQARQIGFLVGESRLSKVEPHFMTGSAIQLVDPSRSLNVKHTQHVGKIGSIFCFRRRMRDEMVVVRENGPSFQLPAKITRHCQQTTMQHPQAARATEVMSPLIGAGGNEVSSTHRKLMRGCVRPRRAGLWHGERISQSHARVEPNEKAGEDWRSPKASAPSDSFGEREASWTAPVLRRFWFICNGMQVTENGRHPGRVYVFQNRLLFAIAFGLRQSFGAIEVPAARPKSGRGLPQSKTLRVCRTWSCLHPISPTSVHQKSPCSNAS